MESQRRKVTGYLSTLASKLPGFQTHVDEEIEDGIMEFCCRLAWSLSPLVVARCHRVGRSVTEEIGPLKNIIAAVEVKMPVVPSNIASSSDVNQ